MFLLANFAVFPYKTYHFVQSIHFVNECYRSQVQIFNFLIMYLQDLY